jgi:glycosyltransferase involved in cell wall biosynthesis
MRGASYQCTDERPMVSVVIPTRDRQHVLPQCLERLLTQSGPPFEIIVVDASSSNATQQLLTQYPMVVLHRLGDVPYSLVTARNVGLSLARGDVVAFTDDDCYVLPGWLSELCTAFDDPSVVAAGGRIVYHPWQPCFHNVPVAVLDLATDTIWAHWDTVLDRVVDVPHLPGGNCAVRREAALRARGFDTNFVGSANLEETDFFLRLSKQGGRLVFVPTAVVEHRAAPRSDDIERAVTNYIYRYSMVRNRLYLLRKHRAPGLRVGIRRQLTDCVVGAAKLLCDAAVFTLASAAGIIAGLLTAPEGRGAGLEPESMDSESWQGT